MDLKTRTMQAVFVCAALLLQTQPSQASYASAHAAAKTMMADGENQKPENDLHMGSLNTEDFKAFHPKSASADDLAAKQQVVSLVDASEPAQKRPNLLLQSFAG